MSIDWGTIRGWILGSAGKIWSFYNTLKYRQIRKEELMTNIDIEFDYQIKNDNIRNYLEGKVILENIGKMNSLLTSIIKERKNNGEGVIYELF